VEHAVLVITDSFNNGSHDVEIPILALKYSEWNKRQCMYRAFDAIAVFLETQFKSTYDNEKQFITVAFQHEGEAIKHNIPIEKMIFIDDNKAAEIHVDQPPDKMQPSVNAGNVDLKIKQTRLFDQ
jgi:hypothetical protein